MKSRSLLWLGCALCAGSAAAPAPAAARDACVVVAPAGYTVVFRKVKRLKPGGAAPLAGLVILSPTNVAPVHGSAMMDSAGSVEIGVTGYGLRDSITNVMIHAEVDADFGGSASLDSDGDFGADPVAVTLTPVDCRSVTIP